MYLPNVDFLKEVEGETVRRRSRRVNDFNMINIIQIKICKFVNIAKNEKFHI